MSETGWPTYLLRAMAAAQVPNRSQLARETGISDAVISRWFNEGTQPDIPNLRRLAPVLKVPLLVLAVQAGHLTADEAKLPKKSALTPVPPLDPRAALAESELPETSKKIVIAAFDAAMSDVPVRLRAVARKRSPHARPLDQDEDFS